MFGFNTGDIEEMAKREQEKEIYEQILKDR
jgi:hypothetical protein